jgi:hypothetical protein
MADSPLDAQRPRLATRAAALLAGAVLVVGLLAVVAPGPHRGMVACALALVPNDQPTAQDDEPDAEDETGSVGPVRSVLDSPPGRWIVGLLALYPILYVSGFVHELGHALMGRWNGFAVTAFGLGTGRPFWVGGWRGSRVYLGLRRPLQGLTFTLTLQDDPTRWQQAAMLAGGVLANFALAAAALLLWRLLPWGGTVWLWAAVLNLAAGVVNLVPFNSQIGTLELRTDGGKIRQVVRGGLPPTSAPERLQAVAVLGPLQGAIGDHLGLYSRLLNAALAWVELGDAGRAEALCAEAEALPLELTPRTRGTGAIVRAAVFCRAGRLDECARALDSAEAAFREQGGKRRLFLVSCARAELLVSEGRAAEGAKALDALAAHALVAADPVLHLALLESRLGARAALPDGDGVEELRAEYERRRGRFPSLTRDRHVYRTLGQWYARRQDWARAGLAYGEALAAVRKLYALLADKADQECFAQGQAALLAEAGDCLRQLGKAEDAEKLATFFTAPEARAPTPAEVRQTRGRRLGWALTAVNALVAVALTVLVRVLELRAEDPAVVTGPAGQSLELKHPGTFREFMIGLPLFAEGRLGHAWGMFLLALGLSVLAVSLVGGLSFAVGLILPALRKRGGQLLFFLALLPWLSWVFWLLFDLRP